MATPAPKRSLARGDVHYRRQTVSGTPPPNAQNETKDDPVTPPVPSLPTLTPPSSSSDRRHFLSKLNILRRSSNSADRPPSRELRPASREKDATSPTKAAFTGRVTEDDDVAIEDSPISPSAELENPQTLALKQNKTRKRTGSLRKTALLGGRRNVTEGAERRHGLDVQQRTDPMLLQPTLKPSATEYDHGQPQQDRASFDSYGASSFDETLPPLRREFSYEDAGSITSSENSYSEPAAVSAARLHLLTDHRNQRVPHHAATGSTATTTDLGSPVDIASPISRASFTSTTDDDTDSLLSFPLKHPPAPIHPAPGNGNPYFPSLDSLPTTSQTSLSRKSKTRRSPLSRTLTLAPAQGTPEPHSYAETETWGWALLLCTWLTFTVGMGSCLDLWSWAWDVGDTPYAPPELEDDPTLPIVGYYPALMVLTGVVAWVWITVAWVGMKYFRHAKIEL